MNLAIITGTTRGLGKALCQEFMQRDWRVHGINRAQFDFSNIDERHIQNDFEKLRQLEPSRSVLILNAAELFISPARNETLENIARIIAMNLTTPLVISSCFLRQFPSGEIAHVTSSAAIDGEAGWSTYCASKAGVDGYLRSLTREGTKTYSLNPGALDTDMQAKIRATSFPGQEKYIDLKERGLLKRPEHVAKAFYRMMNMRPAETTLASN